MNNVIEFAPFIVVMFVFLIQHKIFITPEQLEKRHREILSEVQNNFATMQSVELVREQITDICEKIDKIYDFLIKNEA